jgi:hypothetical protein
VGKLLPGGGYQADNGLRYRDYQSAVNAGNVDRALKQVGSSIYQGLSNPLGLINQFEAARKSGFGIGRPANAGQIGPSTSLLTQGDPTGRYAPVSMQTSDYNAWRGGGAPPAPILPPAGSRTPITSPNTTYQNADEEYRNLLAQYGGAPGISQLAGMTSLPTGFTPTGASKQASLKDYYAAQDLQGNANLGTITSALTQGMQGAEATNMAAWAKANPGLAQQAYAKQIGAGQVSGPGGRDIGSFIGDVSKYADQGQASSDEAAFGTIANTTPAPWNTQGQAVSAPYAEANQRAAEKTSDGGMPALNTTAGQPSTWDKAAKFLNEITPFTRTLVGPGGLGNYGIR